MSSSVTEQFDDDFLQELRNAFLEEAQDLAQRSDEILLFLGEYSEEIFSELFRVAHTLKGSGASVGYADFGKFVHEYENLLTKFKDQEFVVSKEAVDFLIRCNDAIKKIIESLQQGANESSVVAAIAADLESELKAAVEGICSWAVIAERDADETPVSSPAEDQVSESFGVFAEIDDSPNDPKSAHDTQGLWHFRGCPTTKLTAAS